MASIKPAPLPWDWEWRPTMFGPGHLYIVDANGRRIAAVWGQHPEKEATAKLIIESVNSATKSDWSPVFGS